mmetsp:Transcript_132627/g.383430  ORF Transcript_132627/g.383430 Transcript_132627/m.383430 type:complete len:254 (+) Transcript_132627:246-1007(+)
MRNCATTVSSNTWSFKAFWSSMCRWVCNSFSIDRANSLSPAELASISFLISEMILCTSVSNLSRFLMSAETFPLKCSKSMILQRVLMSASRSWRVVFQCWSSLLDNSSKFFASRSWSACSFNSFLRTRSRISWISDLIVPASALRSCRSKCNSSRSLNNSACIACMILNGVSNGWSPMRSMGGSAGTLPKPPLEFGRGVTGGSAVVPDGIAPRGKAMLRPRQSAGAVAGGEGPCAAGPARGAGLARFAEQNGA